MPDHVGAHPEPDSLQQLGAILLSEQPLEELLDLVVDLARRSVAGAEGASVSLARGGTMLTSNSSDEVVRELDAMQYRLAQGPCIDAMNSHRVARMSLNDFPAQSEFVQAAQQRFITAVMSVPLIARQQQLGTLTFYSASVEQFDDDQVDAATLYAGQAAILLANALAYATSTNMNQTLRDALMTREIIGEAKGIIMAREGCSRDEAFDRLRVISQLTNRKLRVIAEELVQSVQPRD